MTGSFLLDALLFLYAIVLPGVALVHAALGSREPLVLAAAGGAVGVFGLPFADFAVAMVLRTHISPLLLLGVSTAVLAAAGTWSAWRTRRAEATARGEKTRA